MTPVPRKILTLDRLLSRLETHRGQHQRIVFTNGCFDILHVGHVRYLREARALGDLLVVGLNGDESVRMLKGKNRPIHPFDDRAEILAAFPFVTYIVGFETESVEPLIQAVTPDVLAKGGDYRMSQVVGGRFVKRSGGEVVILQHVDGRSSSQAIKRLGSKQK